MTAVLLTRPEGENKNLAGMLAGRGMDVLVRPLIELSATEVTQATKQLIMDIDKQDAVIFVSKSSVRYALPLLEIYWPQWPASIRWLSVGAGTASVLAESDISAHYPNIAGSEELLKLSVLKNVAGLKILIIRGTGGRELLATELARRGAEVSYLEVYRRSPVSGPAWLDVPIGSIAVVTSLEALANLRSKLGNHISGYSIVVASSRIAIEANGFARTTIAGGASDQALYDAILRCV